MQDVSRRCPAVRSRGQDLPIRHQSTQQQGA